MFLYKKKNYFLIFALIALILLSQNVFADDFSSINEEVIKTFKSSLNSVKAKILVAAKFLFWFLAIINLIWTMGFKLLQGGGLQDLVAEFLRYLLVIGLFWWLLLYAPTIFLSITNGLMQLGAQAGGNVTPNFASIVEPSIDLFNHNEKTKIPVVDDLNPLYFIRMILSIIIILILCLVAFNLMLIIITAWVVAYTGLIVLGFGALNLTRDIAINYLRTCLNIGLQLMTIYIVVYIGTTVLTNISNGIYSGGTAKYVYSHALLLVISVVYFLLSNKLPVTSRQIARYFLKPLRLLFVPFLHHFHRCSCL